MPMKKELRDKWVAALRSGEYIQGQETLRDTLNNTYCCLGVLCKVSGSPNWDGEHMHGDYAFLQACAQKELGISAEDANRCVLLNDKEGKSFPEIADYIEQNIPVEE